MKPAQETKASQSLDPYLNLVSLYLTRVQRVSYDMEDS